jgi:hypothetical protein
MQIIPLKRVTARIVADDSMERDVTDQAYIAAYKKLVSQYDDNQWSMEEYLAAIQNLRVQYLKGKTSTVLPVVS